MSDSIISLRAREFAALYPQQQLDADKIEASWNEYPEAALVPTGVKAERVKDINKQLVRLGVSEDDVINLVALNPKCVERPVIVFLGYVFEAASQLRDLGLPPAAYIKFGLQCPALAAQPPVQMLEPIFTLAQHAYEVGVSPLDVGQALLANKRLLPIVSALGPAELRLLDSKIDNLLNLSLGPKTENDAQGKRREYMSLMTEPEARIPSFMPEHTRAVTEIAAAVSVQPITSALAHTVQFADYLAPYGVTRQAIIAASNPRHTLTLKQAQGHVREVTRFFRDTQLQPKDYLLALVRDLPTALNILATPKGQASAHFRRLSKVTGSTKHDVMQLLLNKPAVMANPETAEAALRGQTVEPARVSFPYQHGLNTVR